MHVQVLRSSSLYIDIITRNKLGDKIKIKYLKNVPDNFFVLIERLLSSFINLLAVVALARIMGPADYGSFSYVSSVVSVFLIVGHLGLDGLLVKRFVDTPEKSASILGTASVLKFVVLVISGVFVISFGYLNPFHTPTEQFLFLVFGALFLSIPTTSVLNCWFQANEHFKMASLLRIIVVCTSVTIKLLLIFNGFTIEAVGIAHSVIFIFEAIIVYIFFNFLKGPKLREWRGSRVLSKSLLKEGLPLFAGTIFSVVYFKVDVVMLRNIHDEVVVGNYALIPHILQVVQIFPLVISMVAFPRLLRESQNNDHTFLLACKDIYTKIFFSSVLITIIMVLIGGKLLLLIFGNSYQAAVPAFQIACLAIPFMFIRLLTSKVFIALGLGRYFVMIEGMGLIINILVNLLLIPVYAGIGAAIATLASLSFSSLIGLCLFKPSRNIATVIYESILDIPRLFKNQKT